MKRLIFLMDQPLDDRNYERFGGPTWSDLGWQPEFWDITPWFLPQVWADFHGSGRKVRDVAGYRVFRSEADFVAAIRGLRAPVPFVDLIADDFPRLLLKWRVVRAGGRRVVLGVGSTPAPLIATRPSPWVRWRARRTGGAGIIGRRMVSYLTRRILSPSLRPRLAAVSGRCAETRLALEQNVPRLWIHDFDFDIFLRLQKQPRATLPKLVFIDQNICFHSDFIYLGLSHYATPHRYFPILAHGLRAISDQLGLQPVIAAHPRAGYDGERRRMFDGLLIERDRTAELIQESTLVVCHYSTAVSFAVLFGKPVLFVTTDELSRSTGGAYIAAFASALGKAVLNLDRLPPDLDKDAMLQFDAAKYDAYRADYIKTPGSPEEPFWKILASRLDELTQP